MEMHQIRYFLAVCETLNFTRAAEICHVTQPALSRAIRTLEEEVGGLMFRRERSLTHLTDLGRLMKPHLEQILREADAARSTARSFLKLDNAALNLGVMCTIGPLRFAGFLADFHRDHPGIEIALLEGVPARLAELLAAGQLDVAVMARLAGLGERFDVQPLYRERFVIAFPPGHRFAGLDAIPVAELRGQSYLSRTNCEHGSDIGKLCRDKGVQLDIVYRSEREDWIQTMVMAGLGVCFLPEYSPTVPGLQTRPPADLAVVREVGLATVAGRRFSPAVARFIRAIKGYNWPS